MSEEQIENIFKKIEKYWKENHNLSRRQFLMKSIETSIFATALTTHLKYFSSSLFAKSNLFDIAVVEGKNPYKMLNMGIEKVSGAFKNIIKKGSRVVIHPNMSWSGKPESAVNTNCYLVGALVDLCYEAGAKKVKVIDHTIRLPIIAFGRSGLKKEVKKAGGEIKAINSRSDYKKIRAKNTKVLKSIAISSEVLKADVFINIAVAKVHSATTLTLSMKNLMGIVWDRKYFHATNLHQSIVDLNKIIKPDLNIIDAIRILTTNGPQGPGRVVRKNLIIVSKSAVAADAFGCTLFNIHPEKIVYLKKAKEQGLGEINLKSLKIKRIKL